MQRPYHWGIIGLGKIAAKFAEDLQRVKGAQLYAVASRSEERATEFAKRWNAPQTYGSYEALAAAPNIDVVYIATPHVGHAAATLLCLRSGKAVLCEKPFAMDSAEVAEMVSTARETKVFLMEAIWTRILPATLQLLEWIESGKLGRVQSLTADFGFRANPDPKRRLYNKALGGGALLDIGIYPVFLAQLLFGSPVTIEGLARMGATGVDLEDNLLLRFANDQHARLHATLAHHTPSDAWIYGTEGRVHLKGRWHESKAVTLYPNEGDPVRVELAADFKGGRGYNLEAEHVMDCLQRGLTESPALPLDFSVQLMQTLDRIRAEIGLVY